MTAASLWLHFFFRLRICCKSYAGAAVHSNVMVRFNGTVQMHWITKYRPGCLDEIIGHESMVHRFKIMVQTRDLPHLIIVGHTGVGKLITIQAMLRELMSEEDSMKYRINIDASENCSSQSLRRIIQSFVKRAIRVTGDKPPRKRIVVVEKADSMSETLQVCMLDMLIRYESNTRFCFIFSNKQRIIESLQSRCAMLYFNPVKSDKIATMLKRICESENVEYTNAALRKIATNSQGDCRRAINELQSIAYGQDRVTSRTVSVAHNHFSTDTINTLLDMTRQGQFSDAYAATKMIVREGHALIDMIHTIYEYIKEHETNLNKKIFSLKKIGAVLTSYTDGTIGVMRFMKLMIDITQDRNDSHVFKRKNKT